MSEPVIAACNTSFWLDVTKTFIGALLGAGLAFASTLIIQWRLRRRDNIKAGNLALTFLVIQRSDFQSIKKAFLSFRDQVLKKQANAPLWIQFRPSYYGFSKSSSFDLSSLSFLFDRQGVPIVQQLLTVEGIYQRLAFLVAEHCRVREAIQTRSASQGIRTGDDLEASELENRIGPDLIGKANSLTKALLETLSSDQDDFLDAWNGLRRELVRRYGDKFVDIEEIPVPNKGTAS